MSGCTVEIIGGETCVVCPGRPAVEAQPGRTIVDNMYGWNASARSLLRRNGDLYTQFTIPDESVGVACGLAREHANNSPATIDFGFYCYKQSGLKYWLVQERGVAKTSPVAHVSADVFRIDRYRGTVRYYVNNELVHASAVSSIGELMIVSCLYAAGDRVD